MAAAAEYCRQIKQGLRRHANFPPDLPIALGDFGRVRDAVFERLGNISQLGVAFSAIDGSGRSAYTFKSQGGVDVALIARGELDPGGASAVRAAVEIQFSRADAVFFAASGVTVRIIADLRGLEASLIALLDEGRWESDFYVVTELSAAARTTAIASASADSSIRLEAASPALEAVQLGDAGLELQVKRSRNTSLEIITASGHTPLMQLARLRGLFEKDLRPDTTAVFTAAGASRPRFRLAADSDVDQPAAAEPAPGPFMAAAAGAGVVTPLDEPETRRFAAAEIGVEPTPFEKTRSLDLYLPLLRASYDFAHGNPDPQLPDALERIARVEAGIEPLAGLERFAPEAQAAVENDKRALDEEAARSVVAAAIANPDGFGFVARVRNTDEFLVSIRGTQTPEEWVKNFTAVPNPWSEVPGFGLVHLGFEQMWRRIRGSVFQGLRGVPAGARVTMVGHSLGGAMATLGAADVKTNLGVDVNVDLWTVGCPRVGMIRFRRNFNRLVPRSFRVVNQGDIVPHVPSTLQLFAHVGKEVDVKGHDGNPHSLDAYQDGIGKLTGEGITAAVTAAGSVVVPAAATL